LEQDRIYCVSFYVNLAKPVALTYNNVAITKMGIYLSNDTISIAGTNTLPYNPQIKSLPGVYLNDTVNWTEISGTYAEHGGEKYITIGNFNVITDTIGVVHHNNYSASYYFIDDVSVMDCTTVGGVSAGSTTEEMEIYPNPALNKITIDIKEIKAQNMRVLNVLGEEVLSHWSLEKIFNVLGEIMYSEQLTTNSRTIDVSGLASGLYFVEVYFDKLSNRGAVIKKFVKE